MVVLWHAQRSAERQVVAQPADGVPPLALRLGVGWDPMIYAAELFAWLVEAALLRRFDEASVASLALDEAGLVADLHAPAAYRAHLAGVMLGRAVAAAREVAGQGVTG